LYRSFCNSNVQMPEDLVPEGVKRGSLDHIMFITLTVSIDYQRDADQLWTASRATFEDPSTCYLYRPSSLYNVPAATVAADMQEHGLSKKTRKDPYIWRTVSTSFYKKWDGDPRKFLEDSNWDAPTVLRRLKTDRHLERGRWKPDYPYLRGDKIGPLWLRMLRDNVGLRELRNLDRVPIPVDVHVARATLATGVVRGTFDGTFPGLYAYVRRAWFEGTKGLHVSGKQIISLDLDEALWHLSKYGCSGRDPETGDCPSSNVCPMTSFCVRGRIMVGKVVRVRT